MDVSVDTKMWLIFIVVENVMERVKLMWTWGLSHSLRDLIFFEELTLTDDVKEREREQCDPSHDSLKIL